MDVPKRTKYSNVGGLCRGTYCPGGFIMGIIMGRYVAAPKVAASYQFLLTR
jgi:hypothetical protein